MMNEMLSGVSRVERCCQLMLLSKRGCFRYIYQLWRRPHRDEQPDPAVVAEVAVDVDDEICTNHTCLLIGFTSAMHAARPFAHLRLQSMYFYLVKKRCDFVCGGGGGHRPVGGTHSTRRNWTLMRPPDGEGLAICVTPVDQSHAPRHQSGYGIPQLVSSQSTKPHNQNACVHSLAAIDGFFTHAFCCIFCGGSSAPWPRLMPAGRCAPARTLGTCP